MMRPRVGRRGVAVARHLVAVAGPRDAGGRKVGRIRRAPVGRARRPSRAIPRPVPSPRSVGAARSPAPPRSGPRSRRDGGPPIRPGRSRAARRRGRSGSSRSIAAAAIASAVARVRASGRVDDPRGGPSGTDRAGRIVRSREPYGHESAWRRPRSVSGVSAWPWKRPSTMSSDSPCRTRTSVASRRSGINGVRAVSARRPGGSSTAR